MTTMGDQPNRVLITGASGFLGAHVALAMADRGWHVIAGVRPASKLTRLRKFTAQARRAIDTVHRDLLDRQSIKTAVVTSKPQAIVHCAAYGVDHQDQDIELAVRSNVLATGLLVALASRMSVGRFIHVGTCYEYGDHAGPIREDATLRPRGIYGTTKAAGTLLALDGADATGMPLVVIRPFGMY